VEELLQSEVAADGIQIEGSISRRNLFQLEEKKNLLSLGDTADGSPVVVAQSSIVEGAPAEESLIIGEECVITDEISVSGHDPAAAAPVSLSDLPADSIAIAGSAEPNTPNGAPTPESVSAEELRAAQTVSDERHPAIELASAEEQITL
jgi:hypothetical protein